MKFDDKKIQGSVLRVLDNIGGSLIMHVRTRNYYYVRCLKSYMAGMID